MNKVQIKIITFLATLLLFSNPVIATTNLESEDHEENSCLTPDFSSNIQIQYDPTVLNSEDSIDLTITLPIDIIYQTTIPSTYFSFIPWRLRNILLFGQTVSPMQKIHLEILDTPSWANIYFSSPDLLTNIPFDGEKYTVVTNIVISFDYNQTPSQPYTFEIKASCDSIGHLLGTETTEKITFTPSSIPSIFIDPEYTSISAPAGSLVNLKIEITNKGNAVTLVKGSISTWILDEGWGICLTPSFIRLTPDEKKEMILRIGIPKSCTNCYHSVPITFSSSMIYRPDRSAINQSVYFEIHGFQP